MWLVHGISDRMCQLIPNLVGRSGGTTPFRWHPSTACCVMLVSPRIVVEATHRDASCESPVVSRRPAILGFAFRCNVANQTAAVALLGGGLQRGLHKRPTSWPLCVEDADWESRVSLERVTAKQYHPCAYELTKTWSERTRVPEGRSRA